MGLSTVLLLAGCQSGGQSDLVTRELRMQEDQIYAMEDYLAQYQQLLCQVRRENAALKRQIAELEGDDRLPEPVRRTDSATGRQRAPTRSRPLQSPSRAPTETEQESDEMEIEIIEPDVPPLDTTSIEQDTLIVPRRRPRFGLLQEVISTKTVVRGQSPDTSIQSPPKFMQIRGEVVANDGGGGPRLAIVVRPLSATLEPVHSVGAVSLMILESITDGPPNRLARWDYGAAEAAVKLDEDSPPGAMQFHLELPVDVPTDRNTELWVRLMPRDSDKVLGHVPVDLRRLGAFGDTAEEIAHRQRWNTRLDTDAPCESEAQSRTVAAPAPSTIENATTPCDEAEGWSIARPDRPAKSVAKDSATVTGWRAASGPIPVFAASIATSTRLNHAQPAVQQAAFGESVKAAPVSKVSEPTPDVRKEARVAPMWTPERSGAPTRVAKTPGVEKAISKSPARPLWSPER